MQSVGVAASAVAVAALPVLLLGSEQIAFPLASIPIETRGSVQSVGVIASAAAVVAEMVPPPVVPKEPPGPISKVLVFVPESTFAKFTERPDNPRVSAGASAESAEERSCVAPAIVTA